MKLSVIVPVYNAESTLEKCLDSLFDQNVEEMEIIAINDGSKDSSGEILKEYQARTEKAGGKKLRVLTVENGGQGRARNFGLDIADGDYIGFTDSDDWADPEMFRKLIETAEREQADLTICDALGHFPDGSTEPERLWRENRLMGAVGFPNNKLLRRDLAEGLRFPEDRLWYEDLEFTARAIHRAEKVVHLPEMLYHYRRGFPSTMHNNNAKKNLDLLTVMQNLEDELLPEAKEDFDFLVLNHVLLDGIKRVQAMDAPEKRDVIWLMRAYVHEKIPHLSASRSFREESRGRRIVMRLNAMGLQDAAAALLKAHAG